MLTKLVVSVATAMSSAPQPPIASACTIAPGSCEPAMAEAMNPSGMNHPAVSASPQNTAHPAARGART